MASYHRSGFRLPGETDARRDVFFVLERRVVIPTQSQIQRKVPVELPIILREDRMVVIPQMNFVGVGRKSSGSGYSEEAGVDWTKSKKVIHCREQLKILNLRFHAVNFCTQKVPTDL